MLEDYHREQHKKQMAMYKGGFEAGVSFAVYSLFLKMPEEITRQIISQIIKEYEDA